MKKKEIQMKKCLLLIGYGVFLFVWLSACGDYEDEAVSESSLSVETILFSSDTAWPPAIDVNRTTNLPGVFRVGVSGRRCLNQTDPVATSGTVSNAGALTGNASNPVTLIQCPLDPQVADTDPPTFVQLDSTTKTIGVWLNPTNLRGTAWGGRLLTATPIIEFPDKYTITPWMSATSYAKLSWKQKLPRFEAELNWQGGAVVPYSSAMFVIDHPDNVPTTTPTGLWFMVSIFDARPCNPKFVGWDKGTNMAMIGGCLRPSDPYVSFVSGTDQFSSNVFGSTEKNFVFKVTRENLRAGLIDYSKKANEHNIVVLINNIINKTNDNLWPIWPIDDASLARIRLKAWSLNPEVADYDPHRYTVLRVNLAHTFTTPVMMDVWFQRSDRAGFQYGKRIQVPANWSGWGPIDIDMSDVPGFAGRITKIALNPQRPSGSSGLFGFDAMQLGYIDSSQSNKFVAGIAWNMTALPKTISSTQFSSEGTLFEIYGFSNVTSNGSQWVGYLGADPSFQWSVPRFPVDPTSKLGTSYRSIQLSIVQ
jgi:hypothetical protein